MGGPGGVSATCRPLLAFHDTALKIAVAMSASAKGTSSAGVATVPAGRPGAAGLVVSGMPSESAAVSASSRSQVGPPRRLATDSCVAAGRRVQVDHADASRAAPRSLMLRT